MLVASVKTFSRMVDYRNAYTMMWGYMQALSYCGTDGP